MAPLPLSRVQVLAVCVTVPKLVDAARGGTDAYNLRNVTGILVKPTDFLLGRRQSTAFAANWRNRV